MSFKRSLSFTLGSFCQIQFLIYQEEVMVLTIFQILPYSEYVSTSEFSPYCIPKGNMVIFDFVNEIKHDELAPSLTHTIA